MKKLMILACASVLAACGASDAAAPEDADIGKILQAQLFGEKSGVIQMTMIVTVTLDPNDKEKTSKSAITQYFVWDDWGKKTAKYQIDDEDNKATKTLMRVEQSGTTLTMGEPSGLVDFTTGEFKNTVPRVYNELSSFGPDTWHNNLYTDILVAAGFERTGEFHTVHNRECELVQVPVRRYCMWKGIPLSDEMYNAVTQAVGFAEGIYLGEVDARHFEVGALDWPTEAIADLEGYAYE